MTRLHHLRRLDIGNNEFTELPDVSIYNANGSEEHDLKFKFFCFSGDWPFGEFD